MTRWGLLLLATLVECIIPIMAHANPNGTSRVATTCPPAALSRLIRHQVKPGETLESIARQYNLIPATLLGMNPSLQSRNLQTGSIAVGSKIVIPPYNGIKVNANPGETWQQLAERYQVRSDLLFEANGCQPVANEIFVPGVNWSPQPPPTTTAKGILTGYPLPKATPAALSYGWQLNAKTGKVFFHSGLDLEAAVGTAVKSVGAGTVAFAGNQGAYGNLVVINHQGGKQSRYAQLRDIAMKAGQTVKSGQAIGTVGTTGSPTSSQPHLHFEIRYASDLGWVAEDPAAYLKIAKQ
jgi:lysostaphin